MALHERLVERLQPCLEPGEQVQQVFMVQTGPNPNWIFATTLVLFTVRYYYVAVTDRAIVVLEPRRKSAAPKPPVARLPRQLVMGPAKGRWAGPLYLTPDGKKAWVRRRFHKDINAADEQLQASGVQPIGHAGQPPQPGAVPPQDTQVPAPPPPPPQPTGEGTSF
jgi:hypothetical protein